LFTASITASATCGHSAGHRSPRTPLSSGAEVLWPRPGATGVADAMIEAEHSALQHQAKELADVFQRSSSHVEGRNGYLSLRNHQLRGYWLRVFVAQTLLALAKVYGNSGIRRRCGQKNAWYFVVKHGKGMRLITMCFGPYARAA